MKFAGDGTTEKLLRSEVMDRYRISASEFDEHFVIPKYPPHAPNSSQVIAASD
jgi:hypothetical protein